MTSTGQSGDTRLARLRRYDTLGMYDQKTPTSGDSAGGAVSVTIDPSHDLIGVRISPFDDRLREPEHLAAAIDRAHRAAIVSTVAGRRNAGSRRPATARAPRANPWVPLDNIMVSGRPFDPHAHRHAPPGLARPLQHHVGQSGNECVTVVLDLGSPRGQLEVDRAWLSQAKAVHVAGAITEAFADAYRKRDLS